MQAAEVVRDACNGYDLVELLCARRRLISWLEAECMADAAALAYCPPTGPDTSVTRLAQVDPHASAVLEAALCWTRYAADRYLSLAFALTELPATRQALQTGQLDVPRARIIADGTTVLSDVADRRRVETAVIGEAPELSTGLLRLRVEAEVIKVNPAAAKERHDRAVADRGLRAEPAHDGVADLRLHDIPADHAATAWAGGFRAR